MTKANNDSTLLSSARRKQIVITHGGGNMAPYSSKNKDRKANIFFRTPRGQQASQLNKSNELIERLLH